MVTRPHDQRSGRIRATGTPANPRTPRVVPPFVPFVSREITPFQAVSYFHDSKLFSYGISTYKASIQAVKTQFSRFTPRWSGVRVPRRPPLILKGFSSEKPFFIGFYSATPSYNLKFITGAIL